MTDLKCGVIGVGYLGRFHAQKYNLLPNATLVGVCDMDLERCETVATECNVPGYQDYRDLLNKVDAVSIAATTQQHYTIAKTCLEHGIHVLLEKPMTATVEEADTLIHLAMQQNLKLQIGHLERFNPAYLALKPHLNKPLYIDAQRLAPFNPRGSDVNVILDLMIHDIDLIQHLVKSPLIDIQATGAPLITQTIDIANARLRFENGCVANLTASRVSFTRERKMRLFQSTQYFSVDYQNQQLASFQKGASETYPHVANILKNEKICEKNDALFEQIKAFVDCIIQDKAPIVCGKDGRDALATAESITSLVQLQLIEHQIYA